ncbi:MAG: PKD domain-containing protein, partial [Bacteroidales bacterium]|nr:PKD domain-containing protein [Bacteroidales bacterium]
MAQPIKEVHWAVSFPLTYHYPFGLSYTRDCHDFTFSFSESKYESVVWNFGDGTAEVRDVEKPTHTFADDGKYTVNLTVTLTDGIVRQYSTDVEITTPKAPRIIVEE